MTWYVYIAKARTGYYYTGITTNPYKRISAHNTGKGSQMGREQGPFTLIYISPAFVNKSGARKREAQIKRWKREKKEKLIRGEWKRLSVHREPKQPPRAVLVTFVLF
jgi:predicted GIY-YIG superfamily endonuclease